MCETMISYSRNLKEVKSRRYVEIQEICTVLYIHSLPLGSLIFFDQSFWIHLNNISAPHTICPFPNYSKFALTSTAILTRSQILYPGQPQHQEQKWSTIIFQMISSYHTKALMISNKSTHPPTHLHTVNSLVHLGWLNSSQASRWSKSRSNLARIYRSQVQLLVLHSSPPQEPHCH